MTINDLHNLALTGADPTSAGTRTRALHQFECYIEDPVQARCGYRPFALFRDGACFQSNMRTCSGTEPEAMAVGRGVSGNARRYSADTRERGHIAGRSALIEGRWHDAGRMLEDVSIEYPLDTLALQAGHLVDFYTGNARMLRDRLSRAMPRGARAYRAITTCSPCMRSASKRQRRRGAEREGRLAVELEPRNGWAQHSVAHVMEMNSNRRERRYRVDERADRCGLKIASSRSTCGGTSRSITSNWGDRGSVRSFSTGRSHGRTLQGHTRTHRLLPVSSWRLHLRGIDVAHAGRA